jgi:NAD(P)-dependent dehydrogenase (short-subunit alcohol dehydrogenase family)
MKIQGKVFVVTGGGNGVGRELVLRLLAKGARVAAIDMREASLRELTELAGESRDRLSTHVLDITDRAAVEALPDKVIARHGTVDGLINNAGIIQPFVKLNELGYDSIEKVMHVDFYGALYMTKAFLPHLLARPEAHITNISSMGGFLPVPGQTIYGAAKAALKLMTEGLHSELMDTNVKVMVVFPGGMKTNISANSGIQGTPQVKEGAKEYKTLLPEKAAAMILAGIEQNRYRLTVGPDATFMDRLVRLAPEYAAGLIFKQMKNLLG